MYLLVFCIPQLVRVSDIRQLLYAAPQLMSVLGAPHVFVVCALLALVAVDVCATTQALTW